MTILLEHLIKRYQGNPVVNNLSLEVSNGEFFVLLGPSGSGKSTVLRMIAGLTGIDQGRVSLHGRDVTSLQPQQRDTGFVFQHYALFQHMSVGENVEFALRIRKVSGTARRRRRDELLELVGLAGLANRKPHQLSGGQQQRVALARALAHEPAVLLLDEPFGALDAKIRTELRRTLKHVQRTTGMTTIFVTHDQEEAFELADRLGVMNAGRLLEVGAPDELYQRPQTEFVATFLGTANLLVGECAADGVHLGALRVPLTTEQGQDSGVRRVQVLFRPEDVALAPTTQALDIVPLGQGEVEQKTFVGSFERLRIRLPALPGVRSIAPVVPFGSDSVFVEATRSQEQARRFPLRTGDKAWIGVQRLHALTHPGLRFLIATDGSTAAKAALEVGGQMARLAHARITVLGYKLQQNEFVQHIQAAKERLGSGLPAIETITAAEPVAQALKHEVERQPIDLLVLGTDQYTGVEQAEQHLQSGEHHLLIVRGQTTLPARLLICVASGEPAKEDVMFAGRLARHLGAEVTVLSILMDAPGVGVQRLRLEQFLQASIRTLHALGVPAQSQIRTGNVHEQINAAMTEDKHDLLVLGAPLMNSDGHRQMTGVTAQMLSTPDTYPILIVRSHYAAAFPRRVGASRSVD